MPRTPEHQPTEPKPEERLAELKSIPPFTPEQIEKEPERTAVLYLCREWEASVLSRDLSGNEPESWQEVADAMRKALLAPDKATMLGALLYSQAAKENAYAEWNELNNIDAADIEDDEKARKKELEAELKPYVDERRALQDKIARGEIDSTAFPSADIETFKQKWLADERVMRVRAHVKRGVPEKYIKTADARYEEARTAVLGGDPARLAEEDTAFERTEEAVKGEKGRFRKSIEGGFARLRGMRNRREEEPKIPEHLAELHEIKSQLLSKEEIERDPGSAIHKVLVREHARLVARIHEKLERGEKDGELGMLENRAELLARQILAPSGSDIERVIDEVPYHNKTAARLNYLWGLHARTQDEDAELAGLRANTSRGPADELRLEALQNLHPQTPREEAEFQELRNEWLPLQDETDFLVSKLREPGFDLAGIAKPERVEAFRKACLGRERDWLIEIERRTEKRTVGTGDAAPFELRDAATARYAEARAEYVAGDVARFVAEQTEILKKRAEVTGSFIRLRETWKKFGESNLGAWVKRGTGRELAPQARLAQFGIRFINARTVTSGALLLGSAVGIGAVPLVIRQALAIPGAAFGTYEFFRRRYEAKQLHIKDEEIKKMPEEQVAEHMLRLAAFAKVTGSWKSVEPTYDRLNQKYAEYWAAKPPGTAEVFSDLKKAAEEVKATREKGEALESKETSRERKRRVGAGVMGVLGAIPFMNTVLSGMFSPTEGAEASLPPPRRPDALPRGAGTAAGSAEHPAPAGKTAGGVPETQSVSRPQAAAPTGAGGGAAKAAVVVPATPEAQGAGAIEVPFKSGEGPIHQARKAIALHIAANETAFKSLEPAKRVWAETELWKLTAREMGLELDENLQPKSGGFRVGDSMKFNRDTVDAILRETEQKFGSAEEAKALQSSMGRYVDRVNWKRYEVASGHGAWEADNGIKWNIPQKVVAAQAVTAAKVDASSGAFTGDTSLDAIRRTVEPRGLLGVTEEADQRVIPGGEAGGAVVKVTRGAVELQPGSSQGGGVSPIQWSFLDPFGEPMEEAPGGFVIKTEGAGGLVVNAAAETAALAKRAALASQVLEMVAEAQSGLPKEYYALVKDMKVAEILKKKLIPFTEAERWPWPEDIGPNHRDSMRYIKLRDSVARALKSMTAVEQSAALKSSVREFLRKSVATALAKAR